MGVKVMRGTAAVVKTRWKIRRNGGKKEKNGIGVGKGKWEEMGRKKGGGKK